MIVAAVLLCPPLRGTEPYDRAGVGRALLAAVPGLSVLAPAPPRQAPWVASVALTLLEQDVRGPLLPVLAGDAGALAPQLGLSQRAARRALAGYALLDAVPPVADVDGPEWPDAPVAYLASPAAPVGAAEHARLRGWAHVLLPDRSVEAVTAALVACCDTG